MSLVRELESKRAIEKKQVIEAVIQYLCSIGTDVVQVEESTTDMFGANIIEPVIQLKDENIEVRKYAAWIIGNIGGKSPDLLKDFMIDLQHALRDKDPDVRKYISWTIQKIERLIGGELI